MNKFTKALLLSVLGCFLVAGNAFGWSFSAEYLSSTVDPYAAAPVDLSGEDGVFIWANDEARTSWSIRWTSTSTDWTLFSGAFGMLNPVQNYMIVDSYLLENSPTENVDRSTRIDKDGVIEEFAGMFATQFDVDVVQFTGKVKNGGVDGYDFTINGTAQPSFLGFDIIIGQPNVFVGADKIQVEQDFKIVAPVPEPATFALLGLGLLGLAGISRRKMS